MSSNEESKTVEQAGREHWHGRPGCGRRRLWKIPFIGAAILLAHSALVMAIWNALIPGLFHGPTLTYLQAIGLNVLAKLLVGFGPRHFGGRGGHHLRRHLAKLSPEDREKLREALRQKV